MAGLLALPDDIILLTLHFCDDVSNVALAWTCRKFYSVVSLPPLGTVDLLQIERWPQFDRAANAENHLKQALAGTDFFACYLCVRLRSASRFSNSMMRGRRGKRPESEIQGSDGRLSRFCIDCGIRYGRYKAGTTLQYGGAWLGISTSRGGGHGLVCLRCKQFFRITCDSEEMSTRVCSSCHQPR